MAGLYILAALVVIFTNFNQLLPVLEMVFQSAFTGKQPLVVLLVQQSWLQCVLVLRVVSSQMSQVLDQLLSLQLLLNRRTC